jgi:NodT family efflux transporter outer membrane factor (OMF) lipoprotein
MKYIIFLISLLALTHCSLAPQYHRPAVPIPIHYKEAGNWLIAKPTTAAIDRGPWWHLYQDPILDQLQTQIVPANQNLRAAVARYDQARAAVTVAQASYFPSILGIINGNRQHTSSTTANPLPMSLSNDFLAAANLTYEVDIWGRIRNMVAAAKSQANASAADLAFIDLGLRAELANDYFTLWGTDLSQRILDQTVVAYLKALALTQRRYAGGIVPVADVDQAQNQLETAKTLAADTRLKRAQLEHAIAVLIGRPPADFHLKPLYHKPKLVTIAPDLPSTLLERRPDIAKATFLVQAANSNIGVARAAFFPAFNLAASIGVESAQLKNLFKGPSLVWALGPTSASAILNNGNRPTITQTIFDGGRLFGLSQLAWTQYDETVATYRQTVLNAYQDVEDSLIAIRQLDREYQTQMAAVRAAKRALAQALFRYKGGLTTYLEVIIEQNISLQTELTAVDVNIRRQIASVQLIKALGGGWQVSC